MGKALDFTGALSIRMRGQTALQLSGYTDVGDFEAVCREACLRFPLLSSVRVLVRPISIGASEHADTNMDCNIYHDGSDIPVAGNCVSICTMDNLVQYKMAPSKPGGIQYVLALVSGVAPASGLSAGSIMIDFVKTISPGIIDDCKRTLRKLRA